MPNLQIGLLGPWQVQLAGQRITQFPTIKVQALLAYLAVEANTVHTRDALIGLLWADYTLDSARQNLRKALHRLRQTISPAYVLATQQTVQFNPASDYALDVTQFIQLVTAYRQHAHPDLFTCTECIDQLHEAANLYRGDFLAHFFVADSPAFEEWLLLKREWLRREALAVLHQLAIYHERQGVYDRAYTYAWRQVELDPLYEEAHQQLMRILALSGRRSKALAQYEACRRILADELAVEPAQATFRLFEQIRAGAFPDATMQPPSAAAAQRQATQADTPLPLSTGGLPPSPNEIRPDEIRMVTVLSLGLDHAPLSAPANTPEKAAERGKRLLQIIEKVLAPYEARLEHFLGDAVLVVFGAAHMHEDDPERAMRAAFAIRQAAQAAGLTIRAAICTGNVYRGQTGSVLMQATNVIGPVVTLATSLQAQAEPDQILVSEATYHQTRAAFLFTPLACHLRGHAEPLKVFQVDGPRQQPQKTRGILNVRAHLIGRDAELTTLKAALVAVQQGTGQLITVVGEAGVGKSRLVTELRNVSYQAFGLNDHQSDSSDSAFLIPHSALLWLEGRCLELGMTASYWPVLDMLRAYFAGQSAAHDSSTRAQKLPWPEDKAAEGILAEQIVTALASMAESGAISQEQGEELGPLLGNLFAVHFGTDWDERLHNANPEQIRHRTLMALRDFFVALTHRQPVVLVFEDLHWADSLSINLVTLLMETLEQHPLFLLCVYRPAEHHSVSQLPTIAARKCPEQFSELRLRELTPSQSRALVQALLSTPTVTLPHHPKRNGEVSPSAALFAGEGEILTAVQQLILGKAQGNPFFVEEVIRAMIDTEMLYCVDEGWQLRAGSTPLTVPESVQSVILSRVDCLDPALKQVLQQAAVMGRLFRRRVLAHMLAQPTSLASMLSELAKHDLIYQERLIPEEEYSFKHVLVQEAIYGALLQLQRQQFHQHVGEAIEQLYSDQVGEYYEQLAYHYERSAVDKKALEYLLKAGEKARRAYLNEEALAYFQRGLLRLNRPALRPSGEEPELPPVISQKEEEAARLEALKGLGQVYLSLGKAEEAESTFRQAITVGRAIALPPRALAHLYYWLGETLWVRGHNDNMLIRVGEEGLALLGDDRQCVEAALMNYTLALGYFGKDEAKVREFNLRNSQFLDQLPYVEELRACYVDLIETFTAYEKNIQEAMRWAQRLQQKAEQHQDLRALAEVRRYVGWEILQPSGDLRGAVEQIQQAYQLALKIGDVIHQMRCTTVLGWTYIFLGEITHAEENMVRLIGLLEAHGFTRGLIPAYMQMNRIALSHQAEAAALTPSSDLIEYTSQQVHAMQSPQALEEDGAAYEVGRTYLAQGRRLAAWPHLTKLVDYLTQPDMQAKLQYDVFRFAGILNALEEACPQPEAFHQACQRLQQHIPQAIARTFVQWFLEPTAIEARSGPPILHETFVEPLAVEWCWQDLFGDCAYRVGDGLEMQAANGRNLWHVNQSAPRLLRSTTGNFLVQTVCTPVSNAQPAIGGLLLWQDRQNYLLLDRGIFSPYEISFRGCLANQDVMIGRGRLPAERIFLRLERQGAQVRALCSADGQAWFTAGHVEFPGQEPLQIGLHAIGAVDRLCYPGAYPDGTAIRFEQFEIYRLK